MRCTFAGKSVLRRADPHIRSAGSLSLPVVITRFANNGGTEQYSCLPPIRSTDVPEAGVPMGDGAVGLPNGSDAAVPIPLLPVREKITKL